MPSKKLSARYPTDLDSWKSLKVHYGDDLKNKTIASLFCSEQNRATKLFVKSNDLKLDYSKNLLNHKTIKIFEKLLKEARIRESVESMFSGENINTFEKKPALHVALRSKLSDQVALNIDDISDVWGTQERMERFVSTLHSGGICGSTGKEIKNIVNIGIGGSELGPSMSISALRDYWIDDIRFYSVSNGDGVELLDLLSEIELEETLFMISSKSFNTKETIDNAIIARSVIEERFGSRSIKHHFIGISNNEIAMHEFGIQQDYQFKIADWVGGRFSLCSAIGLSLACVIGMQNFRKFLEGARAMDMHFRHAPFAENMPMILAMIAIFNSNIVGAASQAILTYNTRLKLFPAYLQQLHMESLGKNIRIDEKKVCLDTSCVIWGGAASDGQHSYYQLLHQGTKSIPVDFILPISKASQVDNYYNQVNCLAQSEVLMEGSSSERKEQIYDGNRPSNVILFDRISPEVLGQLVALYEHKVFTQAVIYGVNPFDQFGVELGKSLADSLADCIEKGIPYKGKNSSTKKLIELINDSKKNS
jgi:glucose-6-phosphate isomerase